MLNVPTALWPAPAKINLFLHITGRRSDGYHELQTAFQFLNYQDDIEFALRADEQIVRQYVLPGVAEEQDIILRSAHLLRRYTGVVQGVDVHLHKRLPMGGGLGGGSSNAATTLHALNRLWDCKLAHAALEVIGLRLGADVPVFIRGQACWAEGVGERFSPLAPIESWYVIIQPPVAVSTAEIFAAPELTRNSPAIKIRDRLEVQTRNDCEPVVRRRYPQVANALDWLSQYTDARLSGTGACVFGAFANEALAHEVVERLQCERQSMLIGKGVVAKGINRSPLLDRLGPL